MGLLVLLCLGSRLARGQHASALSQVKTVYVQDFEGGEGAALLHDGLVQRLSQPRFQTRFQIVSSREAADAFLKGSGHVWIRAYISTSVRTPQRDRRAVYGGYLSLELVGARGEPLWSWLVTPGKLTWNNIVDDLAGHAAKRLLEDAEGAPQTSASASSLPGSALASASLNGAGATFPAPLYKMWFEEFEESHHGVHISYAPVGSGLGIEKLAAGQLDFAGSDVAAELLIRPEDSSRLRAIPTVLGAVVPIYNLPGAITDLHLTGEALADIYLGRVTRWSDPEIRKSNRDVDLPDAPIAVVHRSDSSGTTWVWSDFLSTVSTAWSSSVSRGTSLHWPVGAGAEHNEGVADLVKKTPNSIGYVELTYAIQNQLSFAAVRNPAGEYIHADLENVEEAAKLADGPGALPRSLINAPGKSAYPIVSFTWLVFPMQARDSATHESLLDLLRWILVSGQKSCSALGYAPLPRQLAEQQLRILNNNSPL
jgi:phosphate transport system substrate-binding protein